MSYFCPSPIKLAGIALATLFATGCLERSTVIKVRKDGSGVVHIRNHQQNMEITIGGKSEEIEKETKMPLADTVQKMITSMGHGVSLASATATTNRNGWDGYELIFEFDDVNQLVIRDELTTPRDDASKSDGDDADAAEQGYRFWLKAGELRIHSIEKDQVADQTDQSKPIGAVDPFAEEPASQGVADSISTQMTQIYAKVLADMRVGVFVEIEGEIESTTAMHRRGNLITLLRLDVGKLLENPDAAQRLKAMERMKKLPNRRQQIQSISDEMEGFDFDAQDPINVRLK